METETMPTRTSMISETDVPIVELEVKRQRFTLTRARELDARLEAILLRSRTALAELSESGIDPNMDETHPVKQQLVQIAQALSVVLEMTEPAKEKSSQIVGLLEL